MTRKTRSTILVILFAALCVAALAAGILAIRFTQGTAQDGDGLSLILCAACAVFDVFAIHRIS